MVRVRRVIGVAAALPVLGLLGTRPRRLLAAAAASISFWAGYLLVVWSG
jgi:hypothetical protein